MQVFAYLTLAKQPGSETVYHFGTLETDTHESAKRIADATAAVYYPAAEGWETIVDVRESGVPVIVASAVGELLSEIAALGGIDEVRAFISAFVEASSPKK